MSAGDLEALLRVTSATYRAGRSPDVAVGTYEGALGRLVLAVTGKGVVACSFEDEHTIVERLTRVVGGLVGPDARRLDPVRRELDAYFSRRLRAFTTPVDLQLATPFARTLLQMTMAVPYGTSTTTADLGARIGRPQALRAVGNALNANPVCVIVPCHRVRDRESYPGGATALERLLRIEG
ncbi:methylated-DNA--[protein]-cysteine S-methyltransferase [Nonomuraea africana]|uniref:Methylated-DNA-[protein]-cysteine S-methyltransferase n=2 Tax=Nonomuraea TaxID=83681 RepID=A0ABR9KRA5_9ACTN|nr:methylated-DNA--[protein]-cysteine S-methyltransferase [Nonomuraea africana]MBE1564544.1 methylated-DNA-[protein]-cysteine S-methyltransferase [Nonomuraea africana]